MHNLLYINEYSHFKLNLGEAWAGRVQARIPSRQIAPESSTNLGNMTVFPGPDVSKILNWMTDLLVTQWPDVAIIVVYQGTGD